MAEPSFACSSLNMVKSGLITITGRRRQGRKEVLCENCGSLNEKEGSGLEAGEDV